jgi:uncharacterized UBP type Zn finger protein
MYTSCVENCKSDENWICLICGTVRCSRYSKSHNIAHFKESGHNIALSLRDLSVWCYTCDRYIKNSNLENILEYAHYCKFPDEVPTPKLKQKVISTGICYDKLTEKHNNKHNQETITTNNSTSLLECPERITGAIKALETGNILSRYINTLVIIINTHVHFGYLCLCIYLCTFYRICN